MARVRNQYLKKGLITLVPQTTEEQKALIEKQRDFSTHTKSPGRPSVMNMFKEFNDEGLGQYSIHDFHKVFIEEGDLSEYKAALKLVGNWSEWTWIKKNSIVFCKFIDTWKEEVRKRLISRALDRCISLLDSDNDSVRLSTAKWIAEQGYDRDRGTGKGRPNTKQEEAERKLLAKQSGETAEQMERIEQMLQRTGSSWKGE